MTPKKLPLMLALLLAAAAAPALADDTGQDGTPAGAPGQVRVVTDGATTVHFGSMILAHGGRPLFGMRTVRNAPYSAQAVSERQQTLGDGNQINQRRDTTAWYRDSAGRTRLETRDAQGELRTVTINDPVAGAAWTLDPRNRIALKVPVRGRTREQARQEAADNAKASEAVHALATAEAARARADAARDGADLIVKRVERTGRDGGRHLPTEIGIRMPQAIGPDGTLRDAFPLGQALANALNDREWKKNTATRDLGTRTFDGVKAEGKLRSYEIPAGAIGNRNPIVVSDETWYAPELQITVYTKHSDPRSGDTVFRLENLKREEPAAALFGVPSDYTVKDALARTPKAP